jgi:hypothetical protein
MSAYQSKMTALAKASPDGQAMVRAARAHAGGKALAEKRKQMSCSHEFTDGICTKCGAHALKNMSDIRYFVELDKDGLTDWVKVAPAPGTWEHKRYGHLSITPAVLKDYETNFKANVYQEHIPIDAEHQTKLSGALAYYRDLEARPDGLFAKLELTDRGQELLDGNAFKYFSPEMYDEWTDPASGITHKNVLTGGAFTTRPWFKDKSLPPVKMSELRFCDEDDDDDPEGQEDADDLSDIVLDMVFDGLTDDEITEGVKLAIDFARQQYGAYNRIDPANVIDPQPAVFKDVDPNVGGGVDRDKIPDEDFAGAHRSFPIVKPGDVSDAASSIGRATGQSPDAIKARIISIAKRKGAAFVKALPEAWTMSEEPMADEAKKTPDADGDSVKRFDELAAQLTAREAEAKTFAEQNKQLAERIEAMESADRRRKFTEMATGRGGENDGGSWFGEAGKHVDMLEKLTKAFGEDSEEVKTYAEQQTTVASALRASAAMKPVGASSRQATSLTDSITAKVKAYSETHNLDMNVATVKYFAENPADYAAYDREITANKPSNPGTPVGSD